MVAMHTLTPHFCCGPPTGSPKVASGCAKQL